MLVALVLVLGYMLWTSSPSLGRRTLKSGGVQPSLSRTTLDAGRREFYRPSSSIGANAKPLGSHDASSGVARDHPTTDDKCAGNFLATQLLPKADPQFKNWSDLAPVGPMVGQTMMLDPVKIIGYDTVSNHLRNASWDLRKEPPCPTRAVSPWINSTIGPDLGRKPLEDCDSHVLSSKSVR